MICMRIGLGFYRSLIPTNACRRKYFVHCRRVFEATILNGRKSGPSLFKITLNGKQTCRGMAGQVASLQARITNDDLGQAVASRPTEVYPAQRT